MPRHKLTEHLASWMMDAGQKLSTNLVRHTTGQAVGPHPGCTVPGGDDRLVVFEEGNWWCRQCGERGWWRDPPPKEETEARREEKRQSQLALVQQMHGCLDWLTYTQREERMTYWHEQGMTDEQITRWGLGFCNHTPIFDGESLSIPVFYKGKLYDIRHRRMNGDPKYTSHLPHLTPSFFNLDSVGSDKTVYVVEGEKKTIAVAGVVKAVIGVPGQAFYSRLVKVVQRLCTATQELVFIPDPGTIGQVVKIAPELGLKSFVIELWQKPDDFLFEYGPAVFQRCLELRRPL